MGENLHEFRGMTKDLLMNFVRHGRVQRVGGASAKVIFMKCSTLTNYNFFLSVKGF